MNTSQATKRIVAPRVVVVIPYYNGASFITRALDSVFDQTRPADEVVVVNDGSSQSESQALVALAARYPFQLVEKANGGQGSARNAGVAASTSEFICFLDQDDFYLPDHIEVLLNAIPAGDARLGYVYADLCEADGAGNVIRSAIVKDESPQHPKQDIFDMLRHDMFVLPSAAIISRSAFNAVGGFDEQFRGCEDDDLFMRIFRAGFTNHYCDRPVTVWCMHTESTSYGIHMVRSRFRHFHKLAAMFPDDPRRGRLYFRDFLLPRFERLFVDYGIEASKSANAHRPEILGQLRDFVAAVEANPHVPAWRKRKLRWTVLLVSRASPATINLIGRLTRLSGIRSLRRLLG